MDAESSCHCGICYCSFIVTLFLVRIFNFLKVINDLMLLDFQEVGNLVGVNLLVQNC